MLGKETALPEGGQSTKDPRPISPGLYRSTVLPAGTRKYFKVRLNESETLTIVVRNPDQEGIAAAADIYDAGGRPIGTAATSYGRLGEKSVTWLPPAPGWVSFSIGRNDVQNGPAAVYGVCVKTP